jgi:transposase
MRTAYKVRPYPDPEQAVMLSRTFGCVRVVWNRTLAARHARFALDKTSTSYLARKQCGSANPAKAKVARQHAKVCEARRDFLHKTSTDLVRGLTGSQPRTWP